MPSPEDANSGMITWAMLQPGYKIINLTEPYYDQVITLIKDHYLSQDIITKCTNMAEDETSLNSFLQHVLYILRHDRSIILVAEPELKVLGALLLNIVTANDFGSVHSRYSLNNGDAYNKYVELKTALNKKTDVFVDFNCDLFMRFYLLCISNDHLNTNFGYYLLRCGIEVCRTLHIPTACVIFPNEEFQKCAELVGFKSVHKISYSDWKDKSGKVIFDGLSPTNGECALMVAAVPAPDVIVKMPETAAAEKKGKKVKKKRA